jgi:hypothetical protein
MGKHSPPRHTLLWVAVGVLVAIAVVSTAARTLPIVLGQSGSGADGPAVTPCSTREVLRVTTASSFAPVLGALAPRLARGPDCVELDITRLDGRAAAQSVARLRTDVWIPDDAAWTAYAPPGALAAAGRAGAGTVVATSPIYMVTDHATAARVKSGGGSWVALSQLAESDSGVRLAVRDPAGSGDGLIGAGALGDAVWLRSGMDASSMAMVATMPHTRTVAGPGTALPTAPGEVGVVPEYALLPALGSTARDLDILAGTDRTAWLRYAWLPSAAAAGDPARRAVLDRVRLALTGEAATEGLAAAGLRKPAAGPPPGAAPGRLPSLTAAAFEVMQPHHADHIMATWYPGERRANLLLVIDVSGSMGKPAPGSRTPLITLVRQGVQSVGTLLPDSSRLGLWAFGSLLDPPRDYVELLPADTLGADHRRRLDTAIGRLRAQDTGTGLYDTMLAAYRAAQAAYRPGMPNQVLVFTDGHNEDDPGGMTGAELADALRAAADPKRPVELAVVAFGERPEVATLKRVIEPVNGYLSEVASADQVSGAFVHVAVGGLRTR